MKHPSIKKYEYHNWANDKLLKRLKELPDEVYDTELKSVFPSISATLLHMYLTDVVWLNTMQGVSFEETKTKVGIKASELKAISMKEMEKEFVKLRAEYDQFFSQLENFDHLSQYEHPVYGKLNATYVELIDHVVNHGTYHRGNITAMLNQQGYSGTPTDYVYYLYEVGTK